jgi:sugar phosphate permease
MASPSLLSAQWFPDSERNRATAVAILANNFGAAVGVGLYPIVVLHHRTFTSSQIS